MAGHDLMALVMSVAAGVQLRSLGSLVYIGPLVLGALAIPFTIFATVGAINAVNMVDGIDGLSGGLVIVALSFIALFAYIKGDIIKMSFIAMPALLIIDMPHLTGPVLKLVYAANR